MLTNFQPWFFGGTFSCECKMQIFKLLMVPIVNDIHYFG
jgi:hypothetical protein